MPDNLTVTIGADTSQLRGQIKLATAELQNLGRQVNAAVRAGDTATAKELSQTFGVMQANLAGLNKELNATAGAMNNVSRSSSVTTRSFKSFQGAAMALGKTMGGLQTGFLAFGAVLGAQYLGKLIGDTVDALNKLQQTASNTNLKPEQVRAFQDSMLKAGISVDQSGQALLGFSKLATEARMKAGLLGDNFGVVVKKGAEGAESGIIRMTGATSQFIRVLRGGTSNAITDISEPFKVLGINVERFGGRPLELLKETATALQDFKKAVPEAAPGLGQSLFGADWDKISQQIAGVLDPTPLNAYNKAWGDLEIAIKKALEPAVITLFPALIALLQDATSFVKTSVDEWNRLVDAISAATSAVGSFMTRSARAISSALPGTGDAQTAAPFAAGGYIRGPGSGTSDSILARLSNGEFVMRAAAVDRWGPQFMMALNNLRNPFGYAGGGLVRPPRFATGGMVTATTADGVTVNLNFPGGSFALRGDREIVGGLTREARRAGMLSAGRMAGALA
jgi:hypothetical protein